MTQIIVALDGMGDNEALALAKKLSKVGSSSVILKANDLLDGEYGVKILGMLGEHAEVMDDAKFHDIPNTVTNRIKKHIIYYPSLITVHASGGIAMMSAAVRTAGDSKILAVTVLTSLCEEECHNTFGAPVKAKVLQFARNAVIAGVYGIVCSPMELKFLSQFPELGTLKKVTPGIRPKWHLDPKDDQARVTTPYDAVMMGADYLVIGRPITKASDPVEAVLKTQEEIDLAQKAYAEKISS